MSIYVCVYIPIYIKCTHIFLGILLWAFGLFLPFRYCDYCCYEHSCTAICLNTCFQIFCAYTRHGNLLKHNSTVFWSTYPTYISIHKREGLSLLNKTQCVWIPAVMQLCLNRYHYAIIKKLQLCPKGGKKSKRSISSNQIHNNRIWLSWTTEKGIFIEF